MKNILPILLLISNIGFCQSDSINPILQFVYDNHGKKVGQGICAELVAEAVNHKNGNNNFYALFNDRDSLAIREVCFQEALPGDIICFVDVAFKDQEYIRGAHMGILTDILGDSAVYANQNAVYEDNLKFKTIKRGGEKMEVLKKSKVVYYPFDIREAISGQVLIYRF